MLDVLIFPLALLLGCLVVYAFTDLSACRPRWAAISLVFGAGAAVGMGLASILFFLSRWLMPAVPGVSVLFEAAVAGVCVYRIRRSAPAAAPAGKASGMELAVAMALVLVLAIVTGALATAWEATPEGNWDAWAIWNLRARFLAADGDLAHRAWSPQLVLSHPEYPLLTSSYIARCWVLAHSRSAAVSAATSYLFFLALLALVAGGLAALRSPALGLLAALALAASPGYLAQVPAQYADVALSCYFAGAVLLLLLEQPVPAGCFAGFAAWTKDEGLVFAILFVALAALFRRRLWWRAAAAAAPAAMLTVVFKNALAGGTTSHLARSLAGAAPKLVDTDRYLAIASAFARQFAAMGAGWYHPLIPVAFAAVLLRVERRRDPLFCAALCGLMLATYAGMYLITAADLAWHLGSSIDRVTVQIWPLLLLAVFLWLRTPESAAVAVPSLPAKGLKKAKAAR